MAHRSPERAVRARKRRGWPSLRRRYWPYGWCLFCGAMIYHRCSAVWMNPRTGECRESYWVKDKRAFIADGWVHLDNLSAHALRRCWKNNGKAHGTDSKDRAGDHHERVG